MKMSAASGALRGARPFVGRGGRRDCTPVCRLCARRDDDVSYSLMLPEPRAHLPWDTPRATAATSATSTTSTTSDKTDPRSAHFFGAEVVFRMRWNLLLTLPRCSCSLGLVLSLFGAVFSSSATRGCVLSTWGTPSSPRRDPPRIPRGSAVQERHGKLVAAVSCGVASAVPFSSSSGRTRQAGRGPKDVPARPCSRHRPKRGACLKPARRGGR